MWDLVWALIFAANVGLTIGGELPWLNGAIAALMLWDHMEQVSR
jgi:hypothetical protein